MSKMRRIHVLLPLGCLLVAAALIGLMRTPKLLQYAFLPDGELGLYAGKLEEAAEEIGGTSGAITLHGVRQGCQISAENGGSESDISLYMVSARWFEAYPLRMRAGGILSYASLKGMEREIVLDGDLAFKLFGDRDPLGRYVDLSGEKFEVVGVAEHARRLGEGTLYAAWIPLGSDESLGCDLMVASTVSGIDGGLTTLFGTAMKNAFGAGTLYGLQKERMRATMILRVIALVVALRLLALWIGALRRVGAAWLAEYQERIQTCYFSRMLGFVLLRLMATFLVAAATLVICWALMNFFVEPVLVFVEWVPEVLVSWAAITGRFWELVNAASKPVSLMTAEMAELRFWANILRWGVIAALIGWGMTALSAVFPKENAANQ